MVGRRLGSVDRRRREGFRLGWEGRRVWGDRLRGWVGGRLVSLDLRMGIEEIHANSA